MKSLLLLFSIVLMFTRCLMAQNATGTELEIGPIGSNQVTGLYSGAIGTGNQVSYNYDLAVGYENQISGRNSLTVGQANDVLGTSNSCLIVGDANVFNNSIDSLAVGLSNDIWSSGETLCLGVFNDINATWGCLIIGGMNSLVMDENYSSPFYTFVLGEQNYVEGDVGLAVVAGANNVVNNSYFSTTLGEGLINKWNHSTVIGSFNDSSVPAESGLLFSIGNGPDPTHRSNAFEVYADGSIKMGRQGDILMGEFGNSGD